MFTVDHKAGALTDVLSIFQKHHVNLTSIESRPNKGAYVRAAAAFAFFVIFLWLFIQELLL